MSADQRTHRITAILGATGTGKTSLLTVLLKPHRRIFLFDPQNDPQFRTWPLCNAERAVYRSRAPSFHVRLNTTDPGVFEFICELAFERPGCVVAIDEIDEYVSSHHASIPPAFKRLCLRGRHRDIGVIGSTPRAQHTHKSFLYQAANDRLCVFRMLLEDLGPLKHYEAFQNVPFLPPGRYIQFPADMPQFPPSRKKTPQRIAPDMTPL